MRVGWLTPHYPASPFSFSHREPQKSKAVLPIWTSSAQIKIFSLLLLVLLILAEGFVTVRNLSVLNVMRHCSLKVKKRSSNKYKQATSNEQTNKQTDRILANFKVSETDIKTGFLHGRANTDKGKTLIPLQKKCLWNGICNAHQCKNLHKKDRNNIHRNASDVPISVCFPAGFTQLL